MIYVDNADIPAEVHNPLTGKQVRGKWSHLITDQLAPDELHEFAVKKLGMRKSYFQRGHRIGRPDQADPAGDHYDLVESKARLAVKCGATLIRPEDLAAITVLKRTVLSLTDCGYALAQHKDKWFVALEWGQEATDSPMAGAAAYGAADTIWDAVHQAVAEIRIPTHT